MKTMMDKFEMLNRQTREWNAKNVTHFKETDRYISAADKLRQQNNETYKYNNGMYPIRKY